ncbi:MULTISPECIES: hypothetical protein [Planktothricoides]|uniref:Uncharacterized protein n=2 Tax=Planktothricoides raciborskii TaxID=132608 RepID=A0AAU8JDZ1_9CYAN|nr:MULTISPECIES: hypothetical protein [Planktothricoides]KOR35471.1 hypothetical protein AM228_17980 [Planktothricoides sp. SR001]MBD2545173.1 hypothetical protein [Planktothricoides raciborskii FACHB-1370]MBD2583298.1 hypothetical protein [Planktothricoides raciborskii FACHB-1261]
MFIGSGQAIGESIGYISATSLELATDNGWATDELPVFVTGKLFAAKYLSPAVISSAAKSPAKYLMMSYLAELFG